jgi:hypothetical protein
MKHSIFWEITQCKPLKIVFFDVAMEANVPPKRRSTLNALCRVIPQKIDLLIFLTGIGVELYSQFLGLGLELIVLLRFVDCTVECYVDDLEHLWDIV